MAEIKTQANDASVLAFIQRVDNPTRQQNTKELLGMFEQITDQKPQMWGDSIIGFGQYRYSLASGKTATFLRTGFSPRKQNLSIYVSAGMSAQPQLLTQLGKHKRSKACLYVTKLADIDKQVLSDLIKADWQEMHHRYPEKD